MTNRNLLLIPQKSDTERNSVLEEWIKLGGTGRRIDKFWEVPQGIESMNISIYGNDTFALVLAQILNLNLVSPDDSIIAQLSPEWTKRNINILQVKDIISDHFPIFIKPAIPKQFKAKVYKNIEEFKKEITGLKDNTEVLLSEIINIEAEARSFILNKEILDIAIYEGNASISEAEEFIISFLNANSSIFPTTFVLDIGFDKSKGWLVIEFNSTWGAGLNNCNPQKIIPGILEATK